MFYDKLLEIISVSEGTVDDSGIYHEGIETVAKTIQCDVQPYSSSLLYREYGFQIDCTKRVFCDVIAIEAGTKCRFNSMRYTITKIIEWDDYMELMLDDE